MPRVREAISASSIILVEDSLAGMHVFYFTAQGLGARTANYDAIVLVFFLEDGICLGSVFCTLARGRFVPQS